MSEKKEIVCPNCGLEDTVGMVASGVVKCFQCHHCLSKEEIEATRTHGSSGSNELPCYKPGWYWMTVVSEGDTWYPIYINEEYCLMDGKRHDLGTLKDLIIKPAVMPTGL